MSFERGVEIGQVFQLGLKYSKALDLKVLDQNGKAVPVWMAAMASVFPACWPASPKHTTTKPAWLGRP